MAHLSKESSRRKFMKRVGLSMAAASLSPLQAIADPFTLEKTSSPMANKKIGWAVVGLGEFATKQLIPSFPVCKHSKLVALVSGDAAKAQRIAAEHGVNPKNIYNYQNYDSLKDNPEVDVIYIVLPNSMHAEYTIRGAQAGKHIMCEKPMATSVEDCEKMIDACKKAGKKLMIAYRAQYEPFNLKAIELAQGGKLGKLKVITSDHGRILDPSKPQDKWRAERKLAGGGSLMDIGIYSLQAARYITGEEPTEVSAMIYSTPGDPRFKEVEENVNFVLRFPSGVQANCTSSYGYADTKRLQVFGSEKTLTLDPATDYYEHNLILGGKEGKQEMKIKEENQFALEMDHLSQCILENKTPKTPGEEGLQDVKLIMAIYESAKKGKPVSIKN
ncbi:Gfo/Idh/MocA family protein [Rufibacter psychrotolerans]|uniref:Gfo/Idh/MocA family protein n=1 Tax=Rufibacter psychrotolerans TaxID=2812556 RepID=UPI001967B9EE|nr:Gfo/Idh/MocA family oxidoreductase [Rufibacter sp. SYSU D00308]